MNEKILNIIIKRKDLFTPLIFTNKQFDILLKYQNKEELSNAEKKALYTSIKKKMNALNSLLREQNDKEFFITNPNEMLQERLEEAKELINKYSKDYDKVFIAGSFLFSKYFNDIDTFIIQRRGYKETWKLNNHIIFLTEKRLAQPIFQSASLISVSNFKIPRKIIKKRPKLNEIMTTYHEATIECLNKEDKQEAIRNLIFNYYLFCKNKLLSPVELKKQTGIITLDQIDNFIKELCRELFSKSYLYVDIHNYIKTLQESIKNIKPNHHLVRFKKTYEELIYGKSHAGIN